MVVVVAAAAATALGWGRGDRVAVWGRVGGEVLLGGLGLGVDL